MWHLGQIIGPRIGQVNNATADASTATVPSSVLPDFGLKTSQGILLQAVVDAAWNDMNGSPTLDDLRSVAAGYAARLEDMRLQKVLANETVVNGKAFLAKLMDDFALVVYRRQVEQIRRLAEQVENARISATEKEKQLAALQDHLSTAEKDLEDTRLLAMQAQESMAMQEAELIARGEKITTLEQALAMQRARNRSLGKKIVGAGIVGLLTGVAYAGIMLSR